MMLPLVEDRKSIDSIPRALVVPKYSITVFAVAIIVLFVAAWELANRHARVKAN